MISWEYADYYFYWLVMSAELFPCISVTKTCNHSVPLHTKTVTKDSHGYTATCLHLYSFPQVAAPEPCFSLAQ